LLRPSNTLLLDEPTNHLDLDSKDVLLDALIEYGGTLIFVSHDRYFVERLATRIIEVGDRRVAIYPGTYREFLWHKEHPRDEKPAVKAPKKRAGADVASPAEKAKLETPPPSREAKKRADAEARRKSREDQERRGRITELETRIADAENTIRELERVMAAPGFYEDRAAAQPVIDRHQALMWEIGDLMHQWEALEGAPRAT